MVSGESDRDAKNALSKLLQMGMVAEYQNEFEMLINRVTGIYESLLKMIYILGLIVALEIELLRARPATLVEAFSLVHIIDARFEAIAKKEKEQIIKKKGDIILSLQSELASPEIKGLLDTDEDIGVDEVSSAIDGVFDIGESNVKSMKVGSKFSEFSENNKSVKEVVVGGGEAIGLDEDESNRVISVLKDGGGEFDDSLDE
nr:retrotransposon Gag protein [Tanacetum cinerariifolium]